MIPAPSNPKKNTHVLIVALEYYHSLNPNPDDVLTHLDGPFSDACGFAQWLREAHDIPGENITLLSCPLKRNWETTKPQQDFLARNNVTVSKSELLTQDVFLGQLTKLRNKDGTLLVFWSGHGIMSDKVRRPLFSTYSHKDRHTLNVTSLQQHLRTDEYKYPAEQVLIFDVCAVDFDRHASRSDLPDNFFQNGVNCRPVSQTLLFASQDGATTHNDSTRPLKGSFYEQFQQSLSGEPAWPPDWDRVYRSVKSRFEGLERPDGITQVPIRLRWESVYGVVEDFALMARDGMQSLTAFWSGAVAALVWFCGCGLLLAYFLICNLLLVPTHRPFEDLPLVAVGFIAATAIVLVSSGCALGGVLSIIVDSEYLRFRPPKEDARSMSPWFLFRSWRVYAFLALCSVLFALGSSIRYAFSSGKFSGFAMAVFESIAISSFGGLFLGLLSMLFARLALIVMSSARPSWFAWVCGFSASVGLPLLISCTLLSIYAAIDSAFVNWVAPTRLLAHAASTFALIAYPAFIVSMTLRRFQTLCAPISPSWSSRILQFASVSSYLAVLVWYSLLFGGRTSWSGADLVVSEGSQGFSVQCDLGPGWPDARHQSVDFTSQHLVRVANGPKNVTVLVCDALAFTIGHQPLMLPNSKMTLFVPKGKHYISTSNFFSTGAAKAVGDSPSVEFETIKDISRDFSIDGIARGGDTSEFPTVAVCKLVPKLIGANWVWSTEFGGHLDSLDLSENEKLGIYISPVILRAQGGSVGSASVDVLSSFSEGGPTAQTIYFSPAPLVIVPVCHDAELWTNWYVVPNDDRKWKVELMVVPEVQPVVKPLAIEIVVGIIVENPSAALKVNQARTVIGKFMLEKYHTGVNTLRPLNTAIGLMQSACNLSPKNDAYKLLLAEALILDDQHESALKVLGSVDCEGRLLFYDLRAQALFHRHKYPEAYEQWRKVIADNPRHFDLPDPNMFNTKANFFEAAIRANYSGEKK